MYYIIVNPASKSGRGRKIWAELEPVFIKKQISYKVLFSKGAGHTARVVSKLTSPENLSPDGQPVRLIILGGDGTLNEALQGIHDFERVLLGYIPTGSSNDFARALGLPRNPKLILDTILKGQAVRTLDLGAVTYEHTSDELSRLHTAKDGITRRFAVSSGIGFDAAVCEEALSSRFKNTLNRLGLGKLTYLVIALRQLIAAKAVSCDIFLDDAAEPIHLNRFLFTAFMIHKYEGGGFKFCPTANASDGFLDLCVVGNLPKLVIFFALPTAFFGKHYIFSSIKHYVAKKVSFRSSLPLWVHTDGEVYMKSDYITLTCIPEQIRFMM